MLSNLERRCVSFSLGPSCWVGWKADWGVFFSRFFFVGILPFQGFGDFG